MAAPSHLHRTHHNNNCYQHCTPLCTPPHHTHSTAPLLTLGRNGSLNEPCAMQHTAHRTTHPSPHHITTRQQLSPSLHLPSPAPAPPPPASPPPPPPSSSRLALLLLPSPSVFRPPLVYSRVQLLRPYIFVFVFSASIRCCHTCSILMYILLFTDLLPRRPNHFQFHVLFVFIAW